ncbi:hypothetical protein HA402_009724 [Bradysia odoriphaga]|nr:hypothetical protein HA402_009724 [Bradysia odoriphaga]
MGTSTEDTTADNLELVTVEHTNGNVTAQLLNLDEKLSAIRKLLQKDSVMKTTDFFLLMGKAALKIKDEGSITLRKFFNMQPVSDDDSESKPTTNVLKIGTPLKPFEDVVDFTRLDYTQKLAFLTTGISNIKVCNGMCIEHDAADKVKLVRKFHKLYRFANGYLPSEMKPSIEFDFESLLTFSEETHSMQTSGVNKTSVSLSTPWVSGEVSYEEAKKDSTSSGKVRSYFTERHVCNKIDLSIDPEQIVPDYEFIQKVKAAVMNKNDPIDKCCALVSLLNEWGWYVPLQITLGSALYSTEIKETDTYEHAKEESAKFSASFKAEFAGIGAGAGHEQGTSSGSKDTTTDKKEHLIFYQIGGSSVGRDDLTSWIDSLVDARTWNIISFKKLYPSLRILAGNENEVLSECLRVLRGNYTNKFVKDLQKFISIEKYEYEIAKAVTPSWD